MLKKKWLHYTRSAAHSLTLLMLATPLVGCHWSSWNTCGQQGLRNRSCDADCGMHGPHLCHGYYATMWRPWPEECAAPPPPHTMGMGGPVWTDEQLPPPVFVPPTLIPPVQEPQEVEVDPNSLREQN